MTHEEDIRRVRMIVPANVEAPIPRGEQIAFMTNARSRYEAAVERAAPLLRDAALRDIARLGQGREDHPAREPGKAPHIALLVGVLIVLVASVFVLFGGA